MQHKKKSAQLLALVLALGVMTAVSQSAQATYNHNDEPDQDEPSHEDTCTRECDEDTPDETCTNECEQDTPDETCTRECDEDTPDEECTEDCDKPEVIIKEVPVVVEKIVTKTKTKHHHHKGKTKTVYVTQTLPATGLPLAGVAAVALATSGAYVAVKKLGNRK